MRVSLNTTYTKIQTNLDKISRDMDRINEKISTGLEMSKISDDPVNLVSALRFRTTITELDQFNENIQHGNTIITASEAALAQIKDITIRAKTLAIQATDPPLTPGNLQAISSEIKDLLDQTIQLGNTQINGTYIFGGQRTSGYTEAEPEPFVLDQGNGHWVNGSTMSPLTDSLITGTVPAAPAIDLIAGDLQINGTDIGAVALTATVPTDGLNMQGTSNIKTAINGQSGTTKVSALLTTLYTTGVAATGDTLDGTASVFTFDLNGESISVTTTDGDTANQIATKVAAAVNAVTDTTGVEAVVGDTTNGGIADSVVFRNSRQGDESAIAITNYAVVSGDGTTGFGNLSQTADATHNTGEISLYSTESYTLTSPNYGDDTVLTALGLAGGGVGFADDAGDGTLVSGSRIGTDDLLVNGIAVPAPTSDGLSTLYTDASAAAKATAINSITDQTGVTATVLPINLTASAPIEAGTEISRLTGTASNTEILANTLAINGTPLTTQIDAGTVAAGTDPSSTGGLSMQKAFNAVSEINSISATSKVTARLTTLVSGAGAATVGTPTSVSFSLNGTTIAFTTGGVSAKNTANDAIAAINAVSTQTGVEAKLGDGTNGGAVNAVVLNNTVGGNENAITLTGLGTIAGADTEAVLLQLEDSSTSADATHNTGQVSFESDTPFSITSPLLSSGADIILNELGLSSASAASVGGGSTLTATMTGAAIAAGDLAVNGIQTGAIALDAGTDGIFMAQASGAKTAIEAADSTVNVNLTTMTNFGAIAGPAAADSSMTFAVNGQQVTVDYLAGDSGATIAGKAVAAITQVSSQSGVTAKVGTGANGGPINSIVFTNTTIGDSAAIVVTDFSQVSGNNDLGFTNFSQAADATHNSGQITISSADTFDLSSPTTTGLDTVLDVFSLGGGSVGGFNDIAGDGIIYGSKGTGNGTISYGSTPEYLDTGDLLINGVDIFTTPTAITSKDSTMALMDGINAKTSSTGIQATRGADGKLVLTASDGRNMHIQTSTLGESVTHINGGSADKVYFGTLQLSSNRKFSLQSTVGAAANLYEPGLAAIGLSGGASVSGEPDDTAGDGRIDVVSIHDQIGTVRYNGDRENNLEIKIGKSSTMVVGDNGEDGLAATTIFTTLRSLENFLNNTNFTTVTGIHTATDTSELLNSRQTGLEPESLLPDENLFSNGSFTVSVTDNDYHPARTSAMTVDVNTATDTLATIAKKIDGMANISARWTADGQLKIESDAPTRYTIDLSYDSSNFLKATGVDNEFMRSQAISNSLDTIDNLFDNLTERISDFGARANRIQIQTQVYDNMSIATKENLSIVQDTDMIKAVMDLKAKEVSYQAALSSAAKTMQLSLVDFL